MPLGKETDVSKTRCSHWEVENPFTLHFFFSIISIVAVIAEMKCGPTIVTRKLRIKPLYYTSALYDSQFLYKVLFGTREWKTIHLCTVGSPIPVQSVFSQQDDERRTSTKYIYANCMTQNSTFFFVLLVDRYPIFVTRKENDVSHQQEKR